MFFCVCCSYQTERKDAYNRHQLSVKHIQNSKHQVLPMIAEDTEEESKALFTCDKCAKQYKTKSSYINHSENCNFVSTMQCPKCMKSFSHKQSKLRHMKKNRCKPVSIIHSGNVHIENVTNNVTTNNITNNLTNNIYINNYGHERLDYISDDFFINKTLKSVQYHIIPIYIEKKHFDKDFPENHNIQYANNKFLIKQKNDWNIVNGNKLAQLLYRDNGNEIHRRFLDQNQLIQSTIQNDDIVDFIDKRLNYLQLEVTGHDKQIKKEIIDIIMSKSMLNSPYIG
jgi:hypothetical protein